MDTTTMVTILGLPFVYKAGNVTANVAEDFLKRALAPAGDAAGDALAHPIREWQKGRVQRAERMVGEAARLVDESGLPAHAVPGRVLWPILEKGSLEDESADLRARWANLLANASIDPQGVHPAFPQILSELSPLDCLVLDATYNGMKFEAGQPVSWLGITPDYGEQIGVTPQQMGHSMSNLRRVNLIGRTAPERLRRAEPPGEWTHDGGPADDYGRHFLTAFGVSFISACRPPSSPLHPPDAAAVGEQGHSAVVADSELTND